MHTQNGVEFVFEQKKTRADDDDDGKTNKNPL